jgi:uncharacterized cupin superfamily protein
MSKIFKSAELDMTPNRSPFSQFSWSAGPRLEKMAQSKYLHFEMKSLNPRRFSYPYHFHRNAEELFVIMEGEATLRSPEGFQQVAKGDILFFEEGPAGAHQLYNHGSAPCLYLDIRTEANVDVCEYPDSGKINILPTIEVFQAASKIPYYSGEENVRDHWPEDVTRSTDERS